MVFGGDLWRFTLGVVCRCCYMFGGTLWRFTIIGVLWRLCSMSRV